VRTLQLKTRYAWLDSVPPVLGYFWGKRMIDAATKDAVFQASIEFIGTLTGMAPPPIETAPAETFEPFKVFTDRVCEIFDKQRSTCTSDEWLANATQSTRDLANKIKGQQQLRPCKHFILGQITNLTTDCPYCEIDRLKSEHTVMLNLMLEALKVIETIESEDSDEEENLTRLKGHMGKLINQTFKSLIG
jgi:hypothetical protein